jgi:hypothetical protein
MGELLVKLGIYQGHQSLMSHPKKGLDDKNFKSPPLKKRRIVKQSTAATVPALTPAAPVLPLSIKERKSTFPLPAKAGQEGRPIRILSLDKFEASWKHLKSSSSISDPLAKRKFVSEYFGRNMIKNDTKHLCNKVQGLKGTN